MVQAALNRLNPLTAERNALKPLNCHEAALGWLLTSMGYSRRWRLIKEAAKPRGVGNPQQFQGDWMWKNIYTQRTKVTQNNIHLALPGDMLCSGATGRPTHSMVVVGVSTHPVGSLVKIRGFK